MEAINCIIKEAEGEYRTKRKDFRSSSHALVDFRKCPEFFRKKETGEIGDEDSALNLSRDFSSVLSSLPGKLRRFCQVVLAENSLNSAAKSLGISKHTLYEEYISSLRKICLETNLKDYLDKSRPF